jgi:MoaA/NifB/PqqE/SkfB family radical SAM enzyme
MTDRIIKYEQNSVYIEPVSACNLECRMCYTNVRNGSAASHIPRASIASFVDRFFKSRDRLEIDWCGTGEVFMYPGFASLLNELNEKYGTDKLSHLIQTNGTTPRMLERIRTLGNVDMVVSIDGPKQHHDWNRGEGNYDISVRFARMAAERGARSVGVRCLVTRDNIRLLPEVEAELRRSISPGIKFHIIKALSNADLQDLGDSDYVTKNIKDDSRILPAAELDALLESLYDGRYTEMYANPYLELSLLADGAYNCCDGVVKIGELGEDADALMSRLNGSLHLCEEQCGSFEDCFPEKPAPEK